MYFRMLLLLLSFTNYQGYGQFRLHEKEWTPGDFPDGKNLLRIYSQRFMDDGKVKVDSFLMVEANYIREKNTINVTTWDDWNSSVLETARYIYNSDGKVKSVHHRTTTVDGGNYYVEMINQTFAYDNIGNIISHGTTEKDLRYTIIKKDSIWESGTSEEKMLENKFENGQLSEQYTTKDSVTIYRYNKSQLVNTEIYTEPKYLNLCYVYRSNGLIAEKHAFAKNLNQTCHSYYDYNDDRQLIKETDSIVSGKALLSKAIVHYEYGKNYRTETRVDGDLKFVDTFNASGQVTYKEFRDEKRNYQYFADVYSYKDDKLIACSSTHGDGHTTRSEIEYDADGMVREQKNFIDDIPSYRLRYYYW